ncbi:Uncharacterised protein [Vibrio cholerae]|nr:Uncharacterised protein [Vibrio cholerae]
MNLLLLQFVKTKVVAVKPLQRLAMPQNRCSVEPLVIFQPFAQ